jgi:hypothetical protein|eukprot:SAG25_NODE_362_length_9148_cov_2.742513_7_plen_92_part_00
MVVVTCRQFCQQLLRFRGIRQHSHSQPRVVQCWLDPERLEQALNAVVLVYTPRRTTPHPQPRTVSGEKCHPKLGGRALLVLSDMLFKVGRR